MSNVLPFYAGSAYPFKSGFGHQWGNWLRQDYPSEFTYLFKYCLVVYQIFNLSHYLVIVELCHVNRLTDKECIKAPK